MIGEQLAGLLAIGSVQPQGFTAEHIEIVREVASQLAIAVNKDQMDEAIQEHARLLERRIRERTEQLAAAKERIEVVFRSISDALFVARLDGNIEQTNPAFATLFGYAPERERPRSLYALVDADSAQVLDSTIDAMVASGATQRVELVAMRHDGTTFPADAAFAPVMDGALTFLICSIRDHTVYKQAEERLRSALAQEKELNALKTSFVSIVSHEFRTPLAVILSSADLLSKYSDRMDSNRRQEKLENIAHQVQRLIQLLDDVLMITRSETSGFESKPTRLDLVPLCQEIIEEAQVGRRQDVTVNFTHQKVSGQAMIDEFLFSHILQNLTSNAIKYSNSGGTVHIDLACSDSEVILRVKDQGIGIPEQHQSRLFEAFRRAGNVGQIQGTGIGLTIVKRAVDACGGTITFESAEGKGTSFIVHLPSAVAEDRSERYET